MGEETNILELLADRSDSLPPWAREILESNAECERYRIALRTVIRETRAWSLAHLAARDALVPTKELSKS